MSDEHPHPSADPRVANLAQEFSQLTADDQDLVLALVARLGGAVAADLPPDVSFMDFDDE